MQESSIKKNFAYSTIYQILNVCIPFITAPYVSRVLGAEGIGIQGYTESIQRYFLLFSALGTITYGAREISMNRNEAYKRSKLFWEIEILVICTTIIALLGWLLVILWGVKYRIYYIVLTIGIFASIFDISWFFHGMEQFKLTVIRNSIFKILGIFCLFIFVKEPTDLLLYIFITVFSTLLSNLSLWPYMKKYLVRVNPREFEFKNHLRETMIYFVPTIAASIYTVLNKTLLGMITNNAVQVGYYQQAEKIINLAKSMVFMAINSVVGVRNSYLFSEKKYEEIQQKIIQSFHFIFWAGSACCFGIIGVAEKFVPVFFGPGYEPVIGLLRIFCPVILIIGVSNCLGTQYYTPCGKRKESAKYLIIGSCINLVLNILLIPQFDAYGATIATVIAETVIALLYIKFSNGYGTLKLLFEVGNKKVLAGVGMCIVVLFMNEIKLNSLLLVLFQIITGAMVYGILLLLFRDEWTCRILNKLINRMRKRDG